MNDDPTNDVQAEATPDTANTPPEAPRTVPLEALEATRKELQALKAWRAEQEAAAEAAELARAEEAGQFRELYETAKTERDALNAQLEEFTAAKTARLATLAEDNAKAIALLTPELQRAPGLDSEDPEAVARTLRWIEGIGKTTAVGGFTRPGGAGAHGLTAKELAFARSDSMFAPLVEDGTVNPASVRRVMAAKRIA